MAEALQSFADDRAGRGCVQAVEFRAASRSEMTCGSITRISPAAVFISCSEAPPVDVGEVVSFRFWLDDGMLLRFGRVLSVEANSFSVTYDLKNLSGEPLSPPITPAPVKVSPPPLPKKDRAPVPRYQSPALAVAPERETVRDSLVAGWRSPLGRWIARRVATHLST